MLPVLSFMLLVSLWMASRRRSVAVELRFVLWYLALAETSAILILLEGLGVEPASVLRAGARGLLVPVMVTFVMVPIACGAFAFLQSRGWLVWRIITVFTLKLTYVALVIVLAIDLAAAKHDLVWQQAIGGSLAVLVAKWGELSVRRQGVIPEAV